MPLGEVDDSILSFLLALYEKSAGDVSVQVAIQDIGGAVGMDKGAATKLAEHIIGEGWAEIRTLSGGIGITETGVQTAESLGAATPGSGTILSLGKARVIEEDVRRGIEEVLAACRLEICSNTVAYDLLTEIMVDLRTLDVQLTSPRPRTDIVRSILRSLRDSMEQAGRTDHLAKINLLLGGG